MNNETKKKTPRCQYAKLCHKILDTKCKASSENCPMFDIVKNSQKQSIIDAEKMMKSGQDYYIKIKGFMIKTLLLSGTELLIFAVIHGFTNNSRGCYDGSLVYLAKLCGCTEKSVRSGISQLMKRGLVFKNNLYGIPNYTSVV